ncbi:hypothetical protein MBAV_001511, partial [Candidatus Magnetobacterium bavaricum]
TVWGVDGVIVPFVPADGVTVYVLCVNVADTVQSAVTAFVVYVVPAKEPPHVPPTDAVYPESGVTVNCFVAPEATV